MGNKINVPLSQIKDIYIRTSLESLVNNINSQQNLTDFKFFSVKFTENELTKTINHGLKFIPLDVIFLGITNNASVSFNIGLFTDKDAQITCDKPCVVRFYLGRVSNEGDTFAPQKEDKLIFGPNLSV